MKVYHGSLEIIQRPEIRIPSRTLDYGAGFYTTTNYLQAEKWVKRNRKKNEEFGYVNIYEINKEEIMQMNTLWFDEPSEQWIDFVYENRINQHFLHNYDFVYGPVANDKVYAAFALYEGGLINKEELIKELKTYTLVDQLLLHTEKALEKLTFLESKKIIL